MQEKIAFDYYYGSQAEQFSFFRLPKVLVRDKQFKKLSSDAKILYGILLDRMSLSLKNGWVDEHNRVFIIFTLEEVMREFECSERKAGMMMAELDTKSGIGLIEKKRQGLGRPNLIYVKNFIVPMDCSDRVQKDENTQEKTEKSTKFQSGKNLHVLNGNSMQFQSSKNLHVLSGKTMQLQSGNDLQTNNTEYINTDLSDTESIYPIYLEDRKDKMEMYEEIIKENVSYETLKEVVGLGEQSMVEEIIQMMAEVISVKRETVRIAGAEYPFSLVKSRLLSVDYMHIQYVLECLRNTTTKIHNIKAYLLTSLFNAPVTMNNYYDAAVRHDMYSK